MKERLFLSSALLLTILAEALLRLPATPSCCSLLLLSLSWVLVPPMIGLKDRWFLLSFLIGFAWDLLFAPIFGPGMIAWSMAAGIIWFSISVLSGRGLGIWMFLASLASLVFSASQDLSFLLIGLPLPYSLRDSLLAAALNGLFGFSVGVIATSDFRARHRRRRTSRLR